MLKGVENTGSNNIDASHWINIGMLIQFSNSNIFHLDSISTSDIGSMLTQHLI